MEELAASRIVQNYRFSFPDGLKELMADLSREVLRAQPKNTYSFIANYFSALLVIRDHLNIASSICACVTEKELDEMLKDIGLNDNEINKVIKIVTKYLDTPNVKESVLMNKVLRQIKMKGHHIQLILNAVRAARLHHKQRKENITRQLCDDETEAAVQHTLDLYKQTKPSNEEYVRMKHRIQTSYEAYGMKRQMGDSNSSSSSDIFFYPWFYQQESANKSTSDDDKSIDSGKMIYEDREVVFDKSNCKLGIERDINSINAHNMLEKDSEPSTDRLRSVAFLEVPKSSDELTSSDDEKSRTYEVFKTVHDTSLQEIGDIDAVDVDPIEYY